jgi:hypothetical protein
MATFEISVYVTVELYQQCNNDYGNGYQAQDRVKTYFEGADNQLSHNIEVYTPSKRIYAPTEQVGESFTAEHPCIGDSGTWDRLVHWWEDYVDCDLGTTRDCDLLLTNASSSNRGVARNNQYACAEGGGHIAELPSSYDDRGYNDPYDAMETAMHEFAHCVMDGIDDGSSYNEHAVGDTIEHSGIYYETMMTNEIQDSNECGQNVNSSDGGYKMRWDDCCESKMEHT